MLEKNIENKIKRWLTDIGAYYFKVHGSSFMLPGIPDIVVCYKGFFIGIEVKNKNKLKNQSEAQQIHQKLIEKAGGIYILADDLTTVKEVICNITQ